MAILRTARLAAGFKGWLARRVYGGLAGAWAVLRLTGDKYSHDRGPLLAAALAFYGFLAVFPFMLLLIAGLGYVLGSSDAAFAKVSDYLSRAMPELSRHIQRQLEQIILHREVVGGLSLLALIWSSSAGFSTLLTALRQVWEITERPRFMVVRLKAVGLVVAATVLLVASVGASSVARVAARLPLLRAGQAAREMVGGWDVPLGFSTLVLSFAMFMALYSIVSTPRLKRRHLALGAAFAALAWELAKVGFAWYVESYAAFDRVYGPMGTVVILLLWIYVSCLILVLGAELAWAWAQRPRGADSSEQASASK